MSRRLAAPSLPAATFATLSRRRSVTSLAVFLLAAALLALPAAPVTGQEAEPAVRVATFNASLNRAEEGQLVTDLSTPGDDQAGAVARIIQSVRPDVLLLNEFDYDADGTALDLFRDNYLEVGQAGLEPITYDHAYTAPSNTGVPSGQDLNNDGDVGGPDDAFGFGFFPGQFGMAVLSRSPIAAEDVRTFQELLWADMPGARLPDDPDTPEPADWFSPEELDVVRLSSKSHWDVPIDVDGQRIHLLASHPTPPVFDGPEDRNGLRNNDEIRLWADYINDESWMIDDQGVAGGLDPGSHFVIAGDQNADPFDGDSVPGAPQQLLVDPLVNTDLTPTSPGGPEQAALQGMANVTHAGDPIFDTADFGDEAPGNLRADYVLPSRTLGMLDAGVYWPSSTDPGFAPVGTFPFPSSDHRLAWVDVTFDAAAAATPDISVQTPTDSAIAVSQVLWADADTGTDSSSEGPLTDTGTETDTTTDTAQWAVVGRDDEFADSLAGSGLAGSGPLLLTAANALNDQVGAEIDRVLGGSGTVYVLGGEDAVSTAVSDTLAAAGYTVDRLDGPTRVETAVAVAAEVEALFGEVTQVALARADAPPGNPTAAWADSITAGAWAASESSPILLTQRDTVHPAVQAYLDSHTDTVVSALGGPTALAEDVVAGVGARRIFGPNRFGTAAAVARQLFAEPRTTFLVGDGGSTDGWAYLLPASGLAARDGSAILLVESDRAPAETIGAICASGGPARVRVVGVVDQGVNDALRTCPVVPEPPEDELDDPLGGVIELPGAMSAEGIASGPEPRDFFAGELNTGDIFRGSVGPGSAERFIDAPEGRMAVGLKYDAKNNLLFVAGGMTGQAFVYDASTGAEVAAVDIGEGFINDVTVTDEGAWFTNSVSPVLTLVPVTDGVVGEPRALTLSGPAADTSGDFNLNGITATPDGRALLVAHSGNAEIDVVDPTDGSSTTIDGLDDLTTPDGILLDNGVLYVVENSVNRVAAITLADDLSAGTVDRRITNPAFDVPTTIASFGDRLAVVNAKFSTPDAESYEVVVFGFVDPTGG